MPNQAKRLGLLLLYLLIPSLLSIPTSLAPSKSWGEIASVVFVGLADMGVLCVLRRQQDHHWLQTGLVIVIAAWIGDGLLQALTGADVFGITPKAEGMINGPFTTNGIFGIIVAALTPLVLWEPLKQRPPWAITLMSGIVATMILSGQHNNLLLLAFGLIALSSLRSRRTRLIGAAALIAMVIAVYPFAPTLQQRSNQMISSGREMATSLQGLRDDPVDTKSFERLFDSLNHFTSNRAFLIDVGLKMIHDRPLTGVGINAFRPAYPLYAQLTPHGHRDKPTHAHNIYLELTAKTGLIGLSGLLFAIGLGWRWFALVCQERQRMAPPHAATLLVMLFPLTTHTVLFAAFYFTLAIMILGSFLAALFIPEAINSPT